MPTLLYLCICVRHDNWRIKVLKQNANFLLKGAELLCISLILKLNEFLLLRIVFYYFLNILTIYISNVSNANQNLTSYTFSI